MPVASLGFVAAMTLGSTLLIASLSKFRDLQGFLLAVLEYDVLPRRLAIVYARLLPPAELAFAVLLLTGVWPVVTGIASAAILLSFVVAVSVNVARGRRLNCHCFGTQGGEPVGWFTLGRLVALLGCAAVVVATGGIAAGTTEPLPAMLLSFGLVLGLYLLGAGSAVAGTFRMKGVPAPTVHGGRVSLRSLPLAPIAVVLKDRAREASRCGACP